MMNYRIATAEEITAGKARKMDVYYPVYTTDVYPKAVPAFLTFEQAEEATPPWFAIEKSEAFIIED